MLCKSCMAGSYVNGVCDHCGRRQTVQEQDRSALRPDTVLHQRYRMGDILGRGGFGITYAAWDMQRNCRVAIKELFPSNDVLRSADHLTVQVMEGKEKIFAQATENFTKEARQLMNMQDIPGVVRIFHLFANNNTVYYAMEFLDGMDLNAFLKQNGPMSWQQLEPIVRFLLETLDQLHRRGVIHRDVSPDNVFLLRDGGVRLIDFGSVRTFQGADHFTVFVKKNFAPWEQYQSNGQQGPWTDIYSLCVTIYFSLSGKLPPIASQRRIDDQAVPLYVYCPSLPRSISNSIMYGMAVRSENRCKTAMELAALLFGQDSDSNVVPQQQSFYLCCDHGIYAGKQWQMNPGQGIRIGRLSDCDIVYPGSSKGISRLQCTIILDSEKRIMVRDEGSSYGTFLGVSERGMRIEAGRWYLASNCRIFFGFNEEYIVR